MKANRLVGTEVMSRCHSSSNGSNDSDSSSRFAVPIVIEMPQVDVDGDEAFFVETWRKKPGDILEQEDVLCDIATPDFVFGLQVDDDELGRMGEIHVEEGVRVPCHTPICTIYHEESRSDIDNDGDDNENH